MPITVGTLGKLRFVEQCKRDVVFAFESSELILTAVLPNVIRHTWVPTHWRLYTQRGFDTHAVQRRAWPPMPTPMITETPDTVHVQFGELCLEATREPFHLRYRAADGSVFLEEDDEGGLSWSYWDYALRYRLAADDHFYGMGQTNQLVDHVDLDHRGHRREVWNHHSPPAATLFPSLLSLRGYGLLVDNPHRATWDLGATDPQTLAYQARGGGLQYYVSYGPDLARLLRTQLELTGFPPLPPRWVFGLLQSRYGYRSREELETIAQTFREKRLPCDALILDVFWFQEMGDLAFQPFDWPDPPEMIAQLKEQGFRVMVIEEPYVTTKSRNYPEAAVKGYLAKRYDGSAYTFDFWPGECALLDFSNPETRAWWAAKHQPLIELGIAGWWTDLNEPAKHFQDMAHHAGPAAAVHNVAALSMQQAVFEAHQRYAPQQRVFILSRSAFPGSQRYGTALWSGDVDMTFAALRKQIALGLNVGMAGIPVWGTDIGGFGFAGQCTLELYVRWFQFGAFCPLFRPHGDQTQLREPWAFGSGVEAICRRYLSLRYRLLPYIYTVAAEACETGIPMMRPLVLEFPTDSHVWNLGDEYLFGPHILVAPVVDEGATERTVYLPAGRWVDFWNDTVHTGPCTIQVLAPLDMLPLFIRQGAILPLGPEMQHVGERPLDPLTLEIYRSAEQSDSLFILYEDDGETTRYRTGAWARTSLRFATQTNGFTLEIGKAQGQFANHVPERGYFINVHHQDGVQGILCNDVPLSFLDAVHSLDLTEQGWQWQPSTKVLTVKLPRMQGTITVRVH
ncbi:MAG: TIM-barrel domain-containing protein [Candidatus Binatia bacterium]